MSRTKATGFFNDPETDDTLQNIRREYLASKKNLQELLVTSPTGTRTRPVQVPTPPTDGPLFNRSYSNDDRLRQQLREGLQHEAPVSASSFRSLPRNPVPKHYNEDDNLRRMVYDQQRQIDQLQRGLDTQGARNLALQDRLYVLERTISKLEAELSKARPHTPHIDQAADHLPSRFAQAQDFQDSENTRVLLNLDSEKPAKRQISNYDDSTTKLLQLAQNSNRW
ncbi:LANO_0H14466g1_1 [Lachancea nothofagi CBS 11611]|uniref:Spindle pole component 29 n=1 Tax=Lachancea nothofagi CBS 11611 TaxID=1266666 RepID=A0A1G4KMP4_9SACH|nr:LANO_0H14466g1_1 [Lachancea nothofagi CBS 11611]